MAARWEGPTAVVMVPAGLPADEERRLVADMVGRLRRSGARRRASASRGDEELMARAADLSRRWLDGRARPTSVRWVGRMNTRWASCSQHSGEIRISEVLRDVPAYVLDYVLVHELAHLVVPGGHPPRFWELVRRYPRTERAMGYLQAYARSSVPAGGGSSVDGQPGDGPADLLDDGASEPVDGHA